MCGDVVKKLSTRCGALVRVGTGQAGVKRRVSSALRGDRGETNFHMSILSERRVKNSCAGRFRPQRVSSFFVHDRLRSQAQTFRIFRMSIADTADEWEAPAWLVAAMNRTLPDDTASPLALHPPPPAPGATVADRVVGVSKLYACPADECAIALSQAQSRSRAPALDEAPSSAVECARASCVRAVCPATLDDECATARERDTALQRLQATRAVAAAVEVERAWLSPNENDDDYRVVTSPAADALTASSSSSSPHAAAMTYRGPTREYVYSDYDRALFDPLFKSNAAPSSAAMATAHHASGSNRRVVAQIRARLVRAAATPATGNHDERSAAAATLYSQRLHRPASECGLAPISDPSMLFRWVVGTEAERDITAERLRVARALRDAAEAELAEESDLAARRTSAIDAAAQSRRRDGDDGRAPQHQTSFQSQLCDDADAFLVRIPKRAATQSRRDFRLITHLPPAAMVKAATAATGGGDGRRAAAAYCSADSDDELDHAALAARVNDAYAPLLPLPGVLKGQLAERAATIGL